MNTPIYGLVLAGGRSKRMGQDKATLAYRGKTQLEHAVSLLEPRVQRVFVSVRADQAQDPARARYAQIVDRHEDLGPIAGIAAAQAQHPQAAWLVLACDLPFLDAATLDHLLAERNTQKLATAYRSSHDGLPEPLCAIYEPTSVAAINAYVGQDRTCPRKFLIQSDVQLLQEPNPRALDNINTPAEHDAAMNSLNSGVERQSKEIKVAYYALLRDQAGCREETLTTEARNPRELYTELKARHPFTLEAQVLRVAVNNDFGSWSQPLSHGDSVVFIPPVAGG